MRDSPAPSVHPLSSLTSAPLIWTVHFLLCYIATALACTYGWRGVAGAIAAFSIVGLALLAWNALSHFRAWRRLRHPSLSGAAEDAGAQSFLALVAMMLCAISALALIWVAVPAAMLPPCAA